jgi:hypothetical protein
MDQTASLAALVRVVRRRNGRTDSGINIGHQLRLHFSSFSTGRQNICSRRSGWPAFSSAATLITRCINVWLSRGFSSYKRT